MLNERCRCNLLFLLRDISVNSRVFRNRVGKAFKKLLEVGILVNRALTNVIPTATTRNSCIGRKLKRGWTYQSWISGSVLSIGKVRLTNFVG